MAVKPIPDDHHVVRHCRRRHVRRRRGDRTPIGVFPDFFHLRDANPPVRLQPEKYLSAVYFEVSGASDQARWLNSKASLFKAGKGEAYARLNAGRMKAQGVKVNIPLRVTHEPTATTPNYATIRGLPSKPDGRLTNLLASLSVVEMQV